MSMWSAVASRVRGWLAATPPPQQIGFSFGGPLDALVQGVWGSGWLEAGPVSREQALSIAAVERGRDEICAIATLPLTNYRGGDVIPNPFLDQPDPDVPRVVMFAQTLEDLLCDGISWWQKTGLDSRGFPTSARRVVNVSLNPPKGTTRSQAPLPSGEDPRGASVWVDGEEVPAFLMIRFDSPSRPLLTAGARTIRRALLIDALAAMYADNPRPQETFTDTDDPTVLKYTIDEVESFLAKYKTSRKRGAPAWVPSAVQRMDNSAPSPSELQLVELQRQVSLELALHMGLDPEDAGVNTTSRTYFNATDRRSDKINRTLAPFMSAITDRLSMGDVTPRGQRVRWDLTEWLRPDPAAQAAFWQILEGMGVIDRAEIRAAAGYSGPPPAAAPAPAAPPAIGQNTRVLPAQLGPALTALAQGARPALAFAGDDRPSMWSFSGRDFAAASPAPKTDVAARTITGLAVPYGAVARKYGVGFRFRPGSLEYDAANLNRLRVKDGHSVYVGVHQKVEETKAGPVVTLKILDGPEGSPTKMHRDQLLMDAAGGLADGLSVGVDFSLDPSDGDVIWSEGEQVFDVVRATWNETSSTPDPAYSGARVTSVAASRFGGFMNCQHCGHPHPAGMACAVAAQLYPAQQQPQTYAAQPYALSTVQAAGGQPQMAAWPQQQAPVQPNGQAPVQQPAQFAQPWTGPAQIPQGQQLTAEQLTAALTQTVQGMVANGTVAAAPPAGQVFAQPINPGAMPIPGQQPNGAPASGWTGTAKVTEPDPYTFTRDRRTGDFILGRGTHDFSGDMISWFKDGDAAARDRALAMVQRKMAAQFNIAVGDVDETNPTKQRPDLWVDQREYRYPIWSAINKGSLTDITPFAFPQFNSASGLVAAHTPGSEPSTGSYTTTGQTITPTGYSGKARLNREVWDQGGNPQTSTLVWNQIVRGVNEALEAAAVTALNAGSFTALATFTAGNADRQIAGNLLGDQLEAGIAALQFARGGYAFSDLFGQADLYLTLAATKATDGRARYPQINPANANGQADAKFSRINVGGQWIDPAWALAAAGQTAATKSYLIDRQSVHGWASPPLRLTLDQVAVAYVDLGVWGYQATAISDTTGVRTLTWDPVA